MEYSCIWDWAMAMDRDQLAEDFYDKASKNISGLKLDTDFSICLCENVNGKFIYFYVTSDTDREDSAEIGNILRTFATKCQCPKTHSVEWISGMSISRADMMNDIVAQMAQRGTKVIRGVVSINNNVKEFTCKW